MKEHLGSNHDRGHILMAAGTVNGAATGVGVHKLSLQLSGA
jgi:hypothetical protein